jgi:hypothetical protein
MHDCVFPSISATIYGYVGANVYCYPSGQLLGYVNGQRYGYQCAAWCNKYSACKSYWHYYQYKRCYLYKVTCTKFYYWNYWYYEYQEKVSKFFCFNITIITSTVLRTDGH